MARGPDIIQRQSIPLSATSDQPVDDVARPPLNASGNADDQASGIAKEIAPAELAQATAARKGDPSTAEMTEADTAKPKADAAEGDDVTLPGDADIDSDDVASTVRNAARMEVIKERRKAREYRATLEAAVKAKIGDEAWDKVVAQSRDKLIQVEREKAEKAGAEARRSQEDAEKSRRELEELRAKVPEAPKVEETPDPRPTRDQFDDPDLYDEAIVQWADREGDRKATAKLAEKEAADKLARDQAETAKKAEADETARVARDAELKTISDNWDAQVAAAKEEKYPDWDDVVMKSETDGGPAVSEVMGAMLIQMPNGTDIAYYLAANVDESKRIRDIPNPYMQAAEIGRLSHQLAQPARRAARTRPIDPVQTNRTPPENPNPDDEDMDAYYARRTKEMAPSRAPFFPSGLH